MQEAQAATSSGTSLTIENAPDDRETLEKKGSWRLQRLAMDLVKASAVGGGSYLPPLTANPQTEEEQRVRQAMLTGKSEELAPIILAALKRWDQDHPGQSARTVGARAEQRPKAVEKKGEQLSIPAGPRITPVLPKEPPPESNGNGQPAEPTQYRMPPRMPLPPSGGTEGAQGRLFEEIMEAVANNTAAINSLAKATTSFTAETTGDLSEVVRALQQVLTLQAATLKFQPLLVTLLLNLSTWALEQDPQTIATMALHQSAHLGEFFPPEEADEASA